MPQKDLFSITCYILDFLVPRCFGLFPLRYDFDSDRVVPSRLWLIVCNVCGIMYIVFYPIAAIELNKSRLPPALINENNAIDGVLKVSKHVIWYTLSVCVCMRQMWFSKHQMHLINRCMRFYHLCSTLNKEKKDVGEFIYPFILRAVLSYFGFAFLNYLFLVYYFGDLSNVNLFYKALYYVPNIVITTNAINFHSRVVQLTICGRQINRELSRCMESINMAYNKSESEFEEVCASAMKRFDYLTMFHAEWHEIARMVEKRLSLLMLFTVANSISNLTQTVN